MVLKKYEDSDWQEGYINNVWCKFKTILSSDGDLYVVAKRDAITRIFMLTKKMIEENKDEDFNNVMSKAKEIPASKIPQLVKKFL